MKTAYNQDFYRWTQEQSAILKSGRYAELDIEHLSEEIESMGKSEKRELVHRLSVLLAHLLKWQYQPTYRGASWKLTVTEQREQVIDVLDDNPSLRATLSETRATQSETIVKAYRYAVLQAAKETGIGQESFPADCPYSIEQMLQENYLPE